MINQWRDVDKITGNPKQKNIFFLIERLINICSFIFIFHDYTLFFSKFLFLFQGCGKTTSKHCLQNGQHVLNFYQLDEVRCLFLIHYYAN